MLISSWDDVVQKLKIPYKKRSTGAIYILSIFTHEKTPSLRMWPRSSSGRFYCFSAGFGGTMIDFLRCHFANTRGIALEESRRNFSDSEFLEMHGIVIDFSYDDPRQMLFTQVLTPRA